MRCSKEINALEKKTAEIISSAMRPSCSQNDEQWMESKVKNSVVPVTKPTDKLYGKFTAAEASAKLQSVL